MVDDSLSMTQLVSELTRGPKGGHGCPDTKFSQTSARSVDALHHTVNSFQSRLTSTEVIVGENVERLVAAESTINSLKAQNSLLMERLDDLENRSRRSNLRILNVPEGSESGKDPTLFVSEMLAEVMLEAFTSPPPLERAHRSLGPKPAAGNPARAFVMCFHRYRDRELALRWARQHEVKL
ncbi:putative transposase element L1Md-A101/L1Md-A102/L1Md-A2 [Labeo rohita]|uniref:Putative transposase element L1Md-A101/L1Md-A102/L1Md-A2 n=1 Tax=Labeo rohita TaxID=84645 RepID=A0A498NHC9_LABRO|nr:putative transposase element L1Md-A101/L1Md-A102/L1Md-A2 [Labeo rohita]